MDDEPSFGTDLPPGPINWNLLDAPTAAIEWRDLDAFVTWLKNTFGLPPGIVPPYWHRHDELIWELSALHTHFLACYSDTASPSAPVAWMREFADSRQRLREWVANCGTRLDRDRPPRGRQRGPANLPPMSAAKSRSPIARRTSTSSCTRTSRDARGSRRSPAISSSPDRERFSGPEARASSTAAAT